MTVDEVVTPLASQDLAFAEGTCGSPESDTGETGTTESQCGDGMTMSGYSLGSDCGGTSNEIGIAVDATTTALEFGTGVETLIISTEIGSGIE